MRFIEQLSDKIDWCWKKFFQKATFRVLTVTRDEIGLIFGSSKLEQDPFWCFI